MAASSWLSQSCLLLVYTLLEVNLKLYLNVKHIFGNDLGGFYEVKKGQTFVKNAAQWMLYCFSFIKTTNLN